MFINEVIFVSIAAVFVCPNVCWCAAAANNDMTTETAMLTANINDLMEQCNETFRIDMEYLKELNDSGSFPDETFVSPKCYINCFLEGLGVLCPKGDIQKDLAVAFWGPQSGQAVDDCDRPEMKQSSWDRCERAYQLTRCIMTRSVVEGWGKKVEANSDNTK